jgi:hypothetical protein
MEIEAPVIVRNPKVEIAPDLLAELKSQVHEAGQVVVHCLQNSSEPTFIRIWPTTFLFDHHSDHVSTLVHAENITYFPEWKEVGGGDTHFTLVFSGLPKTVKVFDLLEQCQNQAGAFRVYSILRNNTDVYYVQV